MCACNAQPAVFNAVPEGFNPDYQEYKVTESPSQLGLGYRLVHTHAHTLLALSFPLSVPFFTHTHTHTMGVPALDYPLGGAVYPDRTRHPVGAFSKQTQPPHGCSSPCCVKTSDQLHSAWPISTYSQRYCCLIWHLYDASPREILLCLTQYEHLILWYSNQCRHLYLYSSWLDRQLFWTIPHGWVSIHLWDSCSIIYIRRCDLHVGQLLWINFSVFNLMVEIDACSRVGWSVYVSSYWLAHSHVPVTGSLIGSQPVIFHSNRQQMKCLCYMQRCCLVIIQEELWPFPCVPLYLSLLSLLFLSVSVPHLLCSFNLALFPPDNTPLGFFPPSFAFSLHACFLVLCKLGWKWKINLWRWEASLMSSVPLAPVLFSANHCITILFNGSI